MMMTKTMTKVIAEGSMPYIITNEHNGRKAYWQTPWLIRKTRIIDGEHVLDQNGFKIFERDDSGNPIYVEIGGARWKREDATVYATREEAEAVNAIRFLCGTVETA
jgi:hypothetical protein